MRETLIIGYLIISMVATVWIASDRSFWRHHPSVAGSVTGLDFLMAFIFGLFWPFSLSAWLLGPKRRHNNPTADLIGKVARVSKDLVPVGRVVIKGDEYEARAESEALSLDCQVEVVEVRLGQLVVRRSISK
jgi:membrane-bound ClpP family serine protease